MDSGTVRDAGFDSIYESALASISAGWAANKPNCPVYRYRRVEPVAVAGSVHCSTTTVEVANDQPVRRSYVTDDRNCVHFADAAAVDVWDEIGTQQIGSHVGGDPALTMEQIYALCQTILAADPSMYQTYLGSDQSLTSLFCIRTPDGCRDGGAPDGGGCTSGINVIGISCENASASGDGGRD